MSSSLLRLAGGPKGRGAVLALCSFALMARGATAQPVNRFLNPEFDAVLLPWVSSSGGHSPIDADNCPDSGSATAPFSLPVLTSHVAQCVAVTPGETLHAAIRAQSSRLLVAGAFRFLFLSDPECTGSEVQTVDSAITSLDTTWITVHGEAAVPAGASSAGVLALFGAVLSSTPAQIQADRAWLGDRPLLLYDGFENGLTCRWSAIIG